MDEKMAPTHAVFVTFSWYVSSKAICIIPMPYRRPQLMVKLQNDATTMTHAQPVSSEESTSAPRTVYTWNKRYDHYTVPRGSAYVRTKTCPITNTYTQSDTCTHISLAFYVFTIFWYRTKYIIFNHTDICYDWSCPFFHMLSAVDLLYIANVHNVVFTSCK